MSEELDRREMLEAALDQAEEGTLEAPIEKEIEVNDDPIQAENNASQEEADLEESNDRDEKGRFKAQKDTSDSTDQDSSEEPDLVGEATDEVQDDVKVQRPTTWKKEYVEIWDKMEKANS